ncbi:diguanylate cyclase [Lentzea sp. NPDC042327]|uniref:GGDEF domain-containing protein n=1 Tax=Lentzea sp. NPDC042327 TaxID=3154801 RepID=UPI0033CA8B6A
MNLWGWDLWTWRPRVIAWVIVVELVTVSWLVHATVTGGQPSSQDWIHLGTIAAGALAHVHLSRRAEERRRTDGSRRHIDVSSMWSFPAALILPIPLVAVLIAATRVQRHRIARKPPAKALLSACSMMLAAFVSHAIAGAGIGLRPGPRWSDGLVILLAAGIYCVQQVLVVGAAILLEADQRPPLTAVLGSAQQWRVTYLAISLGIALALTSAHPVLVALMVGVGVAINRLIAGRADAEHQARDARNAAATDPLTGVLNKTGWRDAAEASLHSTLQRSGSYAVVLVDLDWFKSVNDTFGHLAGDELLQAVARVLTSGVREGDDVGRFGGEELVLALPDADAAVAQQIAERLLDGIRAIRIPTTRLRGGDPEIVTTTASIGVAVSTSISDLTVLLDRADRAMYQAKRGGRDQVVIDGDMHTAHFGAKQPV